MDEDQTPKSEPKLSRLEGLRAFVKDFPTQSGVYLMKNGVDKILYVGKAKNLKNRVRSYFVENDSVTPKTRLLVTQIMKVEYILTKTEVEAFLLEASLIKKHRPKYNIRLKDDKTYPYIRVSWKDPFPRFYLSRKVVKDGSKYFGPFTSGFLVYETIRLLNQIFQIRDCTDHFMKSRKRPCMTHQIGRCSAPCTNLIDEATYKKEVESAMLFLRGRDKKILELLEKRMKEASAQEHYEVAARLRDGLKGLKAALEKQAVVSTKVDLDQDVVGYFGDERGTTIEIVAIRSGRVVGSRPHFLGHLNAVDTAEDVRDWLVSFLNQYYEENVIPDEVVLPVEVGDDLQKLLAAVLEERVGHEVRVRFGSDSQNQRLIEMAEQNAKQHFKHAVEKSDKKRQGLDEIQKKLGLDKRPTRIECYDISHFQGAETVASQVVFEEGVPNKDQYRRYKMKTVQEIDDYASMREVLSRRMNHSEYDDPDLILVDGGKGQLNIAVQVLKELGREDISIISIAKARTQGEFSDKEVSGTAERIFVPGRLKPVIFPSHSEAFRILTGLRDEAHRFAITYHRKLREGSMLESVLDTIPGVGEVLRKRLFDKFGTVEVMRNASLAEMIEIEGVNEKLARVIQENLIQQDAPSA
ncbi:MAG: excinuclease ABC subunit UvrC [Bdellovibrionales bacterium]